MPATRQAPAPVLGAHGAGEICHGLDEAAGGDNKQERQRGQPMKELVSIAEKIAAKLIERKQTIAVAESSTGGLISAALLSVPGASAYFIGGGVIYTRDARRVLMEIPDEAMKGIRSASEPYAKLLASHSESGSPPTGACRKPARPVRPATATATPPATAAWR